MQFTNLATMRTTLPFITTFTIPFIRPSTTPFTAQPLNQRHHLPTRYFHPCSIFILHLLYLNLRSTTRYSFFYWVYCSSGQPFIFISASVSIF
jgi:hypothetical protein